MKILLATFLAFALVASTACNESHKLSQANYDFAVGLKAAAHVLASYHDKGAISDADYSAIVDVEIQVVKSHQELVTQLSALGQIDPTNKDAVLVYVDSVSRSIAKLNDAGVLHLKSPEAQADFKLAVTSLQSAIVVARALIAGISKPVAVK